MIYDKKKGSLLNFIQLPLHTITPYGTYLGTGYDPTNGNPTYILSYTRVTTFPVNQLIFSNLCKNAIINDVIPTLEIKNGIIGYNYQIPDVEFRYGYITAASNRINIKSQKITKSAAQLILEKQLRSIGNVLEKFVTQPLGQPQFDALLHYFYYEGIDKIPDHNIINLINNQKWFDVTDEIQSNIKRKNGKVDERLAALRIETAKIFSYVPGFS